MIFFSPHHLLTLNICTKFHENILDGIKAIEQTRFSWKKNSKGHNSVKLWMDLRFLFSAHRLMMVYICTSFMKIFSTVFKW